MNQTRKEEISASILGFQLPKYHEIPNVGLYLEQTAKYISEYLEPLQNMAITGSMISNYVKKKLVSNPIKKQYNRDQIANLIFIAVSKTVLSMEHIKLLLEIQQKNHQISTAYEYFRSEFEGALGYVFELNPNWNVAELKGSDEEIMLQNTIITVAHKIYLDAYFGALSKEQKNN